MFGELEDAHEAVLGMAEKYTKTEKQFHEDVSQEENLNNGSNSTINCRS
jgi:hypothetical protein